MSLTDLSIHCSLVNAVAVYAVLMIRSWANILVKLKGSACSTTTIVHNLITLTEDSRSGYSVLLWHLRFYTFSSVFSVHT